MIKLLNLSDEKQKEIVRWLDAEIRDALSDRAELEEKWVKWNRNFEAKPETEIKTFPFERASNIVAPIQSSVVNAVIAREYSTLFSVKPFWTVLALNKNWDNHAAPTERLLEFAQRFEMELRRKLIPWMLGKNNYGTAFAKIPWITERVKSKTYDDDGNIIAYEYEVADGPRFIPIPIQDFIFPVSSVQDIQECPWIAHRFRLRWPTIERRGREKIYFNVDKIKNHFKWQADLVTEEKERLEKLYRDFNLREYELYEVWCNYDYDDCGYEEQCVFTVSLDAQVLVRAILNPFRHHKRPFISTQCFPREGRIYGIGYGQKLERLQEGLTTAYNQAIDNASLANARCIKARRGKGIKPGLKIYPGKVFLLDELTDLDTFQLGEIYPSANIIIRAMHDLVERDTGVSSYQLGKESPIVGTSATATSTLALIQEGNNLFNFLIGEDRSSFSEVAYQVFNLYKQFKPFGLAFTLLGDDGRYIEEVWSGVPDEDVRKGLVFEVTASSAHVNKIVEREAWLQISTLLMSYYERLFQLVGLASDPRATPELRAFALKVTEAGHMVMGKILEKFDILDVGKLLIKFTPGGEGIGTVAGPEKAAEGVAPAGELSALSSPVA